MSRTASPSTGKIYGVQRVCFTWNFPKATYYYKKCHKKVTVRRGPQGFHTDSEILHAIKNILQLSPFHGEGYRKIHARLRMEGMRTSPKRVMRIMRENDLQATKRTGRKREALKTMTEPLKQGE